MPEGLQLVCHSPRRANPHLPAGRREELVRALMAARRAVRAALGTGDHAALRVARAEVQSAKEGLGERGPVWWEDGTPDYNRHLAVNTPYRDWFITLTSTE